MGTSARFVVCCGLLAGVTACKDIAGDDGALHEHDGNFWRLLGSTSTATIDTVFVTPDDVLLVVGEGGTIVRRESAGGWVQENSASTPATLHTLWGTSSTDLWAVGDQRLVYHLEAGS